MKKPLKIGLALVIGASVLGIFSDPEPSENRTYEEQQVEEQTPEKDWHEQVLKSLEQKEETEIPDYDQKTQYVDLMKSSLDQDLPVRSLTIKGEGERIQSAVVTIDQKNFEESAQIDHSFTPAGYKEIASENIEGGEFFVKNKILPCKTDPASNNQLTIAATHSFQNGISYWESQIKQYLDDTNNHVLVRADLIYEEEAALCSGIILRARSIEDDELSCKAYVYNEEPDFKINKQTSEIRDLKKEAEEAERHDLNRKDWPKKHAWPKRQGSQKKPGSPRKPSCRPSRQKLWKRKYGSRRQDTNTIPIRTVPE